MSSRMMRWLSLVAGLVFTHGAASVLAADDWNARIASFAATRDGAAVAAGETLRSGDRVEIVLRPTDVPESLTLTFFVLDRSVKRPVSRVFEFDDMPVKFASDAGANVWRAAFVVPKVGKATELKKGDLTFEVTRYGADTHFDGRTAFSVPYALSLAQGGGEGTKSELRVYDFGPDNAAVLRGAKPVTPVRKPDEFIWRAKPVRWGKAVFSVLDPLLHDWAEHDGGRPPVRFRLNLPAGKWKAAAGFGGFGLHCWRNGEYQNTSFAFSADGKTVFSREANERTRFAFRGHEADPDEDVYETYLLPVLPEGRFAFETDGGGVEFALAAAGKTGKAAIDYLAVWPADDTSAEERFNAILERRRARFDSVVRESRPVDRYGIFGDAVYAKERARLAGAVPFLAALENPFDWILPTLETTGTADVLRVKAARGEKALGTVVFRPDTDAPAVTAELKGFPAWARAKVYRLMNYRHIDGSSHRHFIAPNHLLEGPRAVRQGLNYGWCVRCDIGPDAPAGNWRGEIVLRAGARRYALPAELTVSDVTLPALADYRIGLMGGGDGSEAQMRFAKEELGATTVHISNGRLCWSKLVRDGDGRIVGCSNVGGTSVEKLDRAFKTYAKVGFPCKVPYCGPQVADFKIENLEPFSPEWTEGLKVILKTTLAIARSNGCESVAMDLGGEIGHDAHKPDPKLVRSIVRYIKLARELEPGIEYTWRCNCIDSTTNFYPLLDYACIRGVSWEWADRASDFGRNKRIGVYSQGGRFMNGVSAWYHGAKGSFREWMAWSHGLEFNEMLCQGACGCIAHAECVMAPKAEGGYTLTQRGEAFRAGVDDLRYLKLFEDALAAHPSAAAARAAEAFRASLRGAIRNAYCFNRVACLGGPARQDGGNDWPYLRQDVMREACVRYARALASDAAADLPPFPPVPELDKRTLFILDDGPFDFARKPRIGGQLCLETPYHREKLALTLSGNGIAPRTLEIRPRGVRIRQLYWMSGRKMLEFAIDGSSLAPGNYALTLRVGDKFEETIPLSLIAAK